MKITGGLLVFIVLLQFHGVAQMNYTRKPKKISHAQGTFFANWGYNRQAYSQSTIRFVGDGYDFRLRGVRASDNPVPLSQIAKYVDPNRFTVPQYNFRVGYYIRHKLAISLGVDHMKYVMRDNNEVRIDGQINPGVDPLWSGTFLNTAITTNRKHFHYENSNGLNYIRFNITKSELLKRNAKRTLALTGHYGLGFGGLLSYNNFRFGGKEDLATVSMSGFGVTGNASLRAEFFNHFYIEAEGSMGYMNQLYVRTRANDRFSYAKQQFTYAMYSVQAGFLLYIRPVNGCDDCPKW